MYACVSTCQSWQDIGIVQLKINVAQCLGHSTIIKKLPVIRIRWSHDHLIFIWKPLNPFLYPISLQTGSLCDMIWFILWFLQFLYAVPKECLSTGGWWKCCQISCLSSGGPTNLEGIPLLNFSKSCVYHVVECFCVSPLSVNWISFSSISLNSVANGLKLIMKWHTTYHARTNKDWIMIHVLKFACCSKDISRNFIGIYNISQTWESARLIFFIIILFCTTIFFLLPSGLLH